MLAVPEGEPSFEGGNFDGDLARGLPVPAWRVIFPRACLAPVTAPELSGFCEMINLRTFWTWVEVFFLSSGSGLAFCRLRALLTVVEVRR